MNFGVFALFTTLGAMVWNGILAALGWWLAQRVSIAQLYDAVERYNGYLTLGGIIILVLCVLYIIYNAFTKKPQKVK